MMEKEELILLFSLDQPPSLGQEVENVLFPS
jgi:hypothetical protein